MNKSKGFTIIELIVVIAIIAVLAAIVLVNVTSYINKGKDAAIKGNLASIMTQGAVWQDGHTDFNGFCASTGPAAALAQADATWGTTGGTAANCAAKTADNSSWCACKQEKVNTSLYFCVDSTGVKRDAAVACATTCNATVAACQ